MFRFIALVWDSSLPDASNTARLLGASLKSQSTDWQCVYQSDGIEVFCAGSHSGPSTIYPLHELGGVVLGVLFDRRLPPGEPAEQRARLTDQESRRIRATGGRDLVNSYWGRYVAVIRGTDPNEVYIVRDPSGALECFVAKFGSVQMYFSSLHECPPLDGSKLSVDWDYVAAAASGALPESRSTGLKEVTRVLRGECVSAGRGSKCFYWDPVVFAQSPRDGDFQSLATELRLTVRSCVQAWASSYAEITQSLSGGLDSSIILSCLGNVPASVSCLNYYYSSGSGGDEREFARLVANHLHRPLIERELDAQIRLEGIQDAPRSHCPSNIVPYYVISQTDQKAGAPFSTGSRFHGFGGDQLFYQNGARQAVADYVRRRKIDSYLIGFAAEAARAEESTVWSMLKGGLRLAMSRDHLPLAASIWAPPSAIRTQARTTAQDSALFLHPWLVGRSGVSPGKFWQIHLLTLAETERTYGPFWKPGESENVSPLVSQPVVELCLRLPSYVLMAGGFDRALARLAFRGDLPDQTIQRRSKGLVREHPKAVLDFNRRFVRECLLNGLLVREGILDMAKLKATLNSEISKSDANPSIVFRWLSIESWVQQETALPRRAIAA